MALQRLKKKSHKLLSFTPSPLYPYVAEKFNSADSQGGFMDQCRMTKEIVDWIREHPWKRGNQVRYDGSCKNPNTPYAEHCSLYIGEKKRGKGRGSQVAQVDILTEDLATMTVDLLIELEPEHTPKKTLGEVLPTLLAENYTPSRLVGAANQRQIKDAVFLFVTVVPNKQGSQKRSQLLGLEETIIRKLDFHELVVRTVKFCIGSSEADAVQQCKNAIEELLIRRCPENLHRSCIEP
jgi:hypothetical protein